MNANGAPCLLDVSVGKFCSNFMRQHYASAVCVYQIVVKLLPKINAALKCHILSVRRSKNYNQAHKCWAVLLHT